MWFKYVKLPCMGKVDVEYILEALEQGADGVCVVACLLGNCHHVGGNMRATKRVAYTRKLLDGIGLGSARLGIYYMSGGQGHAFAEAATEMTEKVKKLGPSPLGQAIQHPHG